MASSKRYSEADRRGRNSNQDVTNIGVAGRRTGLRVEGARRGSDGFENESAFFSPATTAKKAPRTTDIISSARRSPGQSAIRGAGGSGSFRSMELEESSAQDVTSALKRRGSQVLRSPQKSAARRLDSPTRTTLNSPALRVRNTGARMSPPKSALRSPGRPAAHIAANSISSKVARKLDFSVADPAGTGESSEADVLAEPKNDRSKPRISNVKNTARQPKVQSEEAEEDEMAEPILTNDMLIGNDDDDDDALPDVVLEAARQDNDVAYNDDAAAAAMNEPEPQFDQYLNDDDDADQEFASAQEDAPAEEEPIAQKPAAQSKKRKAATTTTFPKSARATSTSREDDAGPEADKENEREEDSGKPTRKRGRTAGKARAKSAPRTASQSRDRREGSVRGTSPQRKWVEPVMHHDDGNDKEDGDGGTRRSSRFKIAPLAFWRGEKLVYGRGSRRKSVNGTIAFELPAIKEIIHVEPAEPLGRSSTTTTTTTKRSTSRRRRHRSRVKSESSAEESSSDDDGEGWEETVTIEAPVRSYDDPHGPLVKKTLGLPASRYELNEVVGQGIFFQKTLSEEPHFAAGVLDIPVGAGKPSKPSKQNTMFFFIFTGYVEIKIAENVFRLRRGGQFTIPRGNQYEIRNVGRKDARLFFSQSTDTLANHLISHPESIQREPDVEVADEQDEQDDA